MRARLVSAAAVAALLPALMMVGAQPAVAGGNGGNGNAGSVKISTVGGPADESNEPHVGCSFDVQWYGFSRTTSTVTFVSQAPTADAVIERTGPASVLLGDADEDKLNTRRTYTLAFTGADPHQNQGYKVKMTVNVPGAQGADDKHKVFWVECDRADQPTDPGGTDPGETDPGETDPGDTDPGETDPGNQPTDPFDWDWRYDDPTCTGVTVDYPADIPANQANDVNVRVETDHGTQTLNYHKNDGTWSGSHPFNLADHPAWDAGTASYAITWVQVGGTNYHWKGDVSCITDGDPATADTPRGVTDVAGFRTGSITVDRGSNVTSDTVVVDQAGDEDLLLQMWTPGAARGLAARSGGGWRTVKAVATNANGAAKVTFPKLRKKGTYRFRLAVAGSTGATGDTTGTLTVRVR